MISICPLYLRCHYKLRDCTTHLCESSIRVFNEGITIGRGRTLKTSIKIEVELRLDNTNQWYAMITDVLGYARDLGFKEIKIKPEGYSMMK